MLRIPKEVQGGLLLTISSFVGLALAFPVSIMVARYLGPAGIGTYAFVLNFGMVGRVFAALSLQDALIPLFKSKPDSKLYDTAWFLTKLSALSLLIVPASLAGYILAGQSEGNWQLALQTLIVLGAYLFSDHEVFSIWCKCEKHYSRFVLIDLGGLLIGLTLRILVVLTRGTITELLLTFLLEQLARTAIALILYLRAGRPFMNPPAWSREKACRLLSKAWPIWLGALLTVCYAAVDQFLLGVLLKNSDNLGYYFVASKFVEAFAVGSIALFVVYLPILSSGEKIELHLQRLHDLSVWSFTVLVILLYFVSEPVITTLYGHSYQKAANLTITCIWFLPPLFLGAARSAYLYTHNMQKVDMGLKSLGVFGNLALDLYFIPVYGARGAVVTTVFVQWLVFVLACFFVPKLRPVRRAALSALFLPGSAWRLFIWLKSSPESSKYRLQPQPAPPPEECDRGPDRG